MDGIVSSRTRQAKFLFNHDIYSDRYTFSVEIVPICYGDLIFLLLKELLCLIFTLRYCILNVDQYWNALFTPSLTRSQLVEYSVLDIVERYSVVPYYAKYVDISNKDSETVTANRQINSQ
ncbi:hypothetical protein MTR_5g092980 [Medicago truncatula]|uniref:Uncharacterized protein n=1 Tax=Medicago truncatula TaxID=3880 RepID=G7K3J0_MEDTR|nr:hypothetical protein MTR_5g092980 [Medicago truncatula]